MKKGLIFFILVVLVLAGYLVYDNLGTNTMKVTNTIKEPSFTIEMPNKFYEDTKNVYICDSTYMFVEFDYYPNELKFDSESMLYTVLINEFYEDDIISVQEVSIGGEAAWQAQYRTLATGNDGIHYYYSGVITAFELENEIVVIDAYNAMDESEGINSTISDSDLQLLKDIINSVKITDKEYENIEITEQRMEVNNLTLTLSNNWVESVEGDNGVYDFGYYGSYSYADLPIWVDVYEYNEENINDVASLETAPEGYTLLGKETIVGEETYLFSYDSNSYDGLSPYFCGVVAVSEHYYIDVYFKTYEGNYKLNDDILDAFVKLITDIE